MASQTVLVVGLGNPGPDYTATRHNIGFIALDNFAEEKGLRIESEKWKGLYCRDRVGSSSLFLLKPQTYMNRSGECVIRFCDYFKIEPSQVLVLHDDLDLPLGRIKLVRSGGPGGHNGIRSLIQHLGTKDFPRLKIGIGRPQPGEKGGSIPVDRYVLSKFPPDESSLIKQRFDLISEAIDLFLSKDISATMNEINGRS